MNAVRPNARDHGRLDPFVDSPGPVQHRIRRPKFTVTEGTSDPDYGPKERVLARTSPLPAKRNIPDYLTSGDKDDLPMPKKGNKNGY